MAWRNAILAATATLALAACNKPVGEKAASAEGAAKPATAAAPAAGPAPMPSRKPGLWKQTVSTAGMTQTSTICLDKAVESKLAVWGAGASKDMCKQTAMAPIAGGWTFTSACDMGTGGKTTTQGKVTGDFDTSYKVEASSVTEGAGAPQMNGEHKMLMEATWQGPCPADMKPGDMALPNGMKINMLAATEGMPMMKRPAK